MPNIYRSATLFGVLFTVCSPDHHRTGGGCIMYAGPSYGSQWLLHHKAMHIVLHARACLKRTHAECGTLAVCTLSRFALLHCKLQSALASRPIRSPIEFSLLGQREHSECWRHSVGVGASEEPHTVCNAYYVYCIEYYVLHLAYGLIISACR